MKFISRHILPVLCAVMAVAAAGCIKDNIPYPHIQANIITIAAEDQSQNAQIDSLLRSVTLFFGETANIYDVKITDLTLTPGSEIVGDDITGGIDLSSPRHVIVRLYQDYMWTISARQNIERYFTIGGQVGSTEIDVPARRVVAYVSETTDLESVLVKTIKLWPENATVDKDLEGKRVDFSRPVEIVADIHGHKETWTIYIVQTESVVTTLRVDPWTNVAWVYGQAEAGRDNGVEYRLATDSEWTRVPESMMSYDGGSFHARIIHLSPETSYVARAFSNQDYGDEIEFTTGQVLQVPNSDFDSWWLDGKVWNPWADGGVPFWDTGNKGATTLGSSNTTPTDDTVSGTGLAARLETRFVGIGIIGKLAAGNIFAGSYVRTDGTNGILSFGREFTARPTKLSGYLKYQTAPISSTTAGFGDLAGRPDTCIVWVALIDSEQPFEIRTNPNNRQLFDPDGPEVIAYGKIEFGENVPTYTPFEFTLDYKATDRVPRYILITASASKYGDYFTGGNGAVLYLDDFELQYDY